MKNEDLAFSRSLTLPARMASFGPFMEFLRKTGESMNLEASLVSRLGLAAEELLVNVIHYAYAEAEEPGDIELRCGMADAETFCMVIRDRGTPFNPLLTEDPDITKSVNERAVGGLGLFLVREIADHLDYFREKDANIVVFCKKVPRMEVGRFAPSKDI